MAGFGFSCGKSAVEWNVLLYLYWLGVEFTPQFLSRETLYTIYFPNLRWTILSYFYEKNLLKLLPKNLVRKLKTEPNFVDKLCAEITFSGKLLWN